MSVLYSAIVCLAFVPTSMATLSSFSFDCANKQQPDVKCFASPRHWCFHEKHQIAIQCFLGRPFACGWGERPASSGMPPNDICLGEGFLSEEADAVVTCRVDPAKSSIAQVEISLKPTEEERESMSKKIAAAFKKTEQSSDCRTALLFTTSNRQHLQKLLDFTKSACPNNVNDGCPVPIEGSLEGAKATAHLYNVELPTSGDILNCHLKIEADGAIGTKANPQLIKGYTVIDYAIKFEVQKTTDARIKGVDAFAVNILEIMPANRGQVVNTKKQNVVISKKTTEIKMEKITNDGFAANMKQLIPLFRTQVEASLELLVKTHI